MYFFHLLPTSSHLHTLQVENCDSNSRLVEDEDDYGKFRLEGVKGLMRHLWTLNADGQSTLPCPANNRRPINAGSMLGRRRRRWTNINPALVQSLLCVWAVTLVTNHTCNICLLWLMACDVYPAYYWSYTNQQIASHRIHMLKWTLNRINSLNNWN